MYPRRFQAETPLIPLVKFPEPAPRRWVARWRDKEFSSKQWTEDHPMGRANLCNASLSEIILSRVTTLIGGPPPARMMIPISLGPVWRARSTSSKRSEEDHGDALHASQGSGNILKAKIPLNARKP